MVGYGVGEAGKLPVAIRRGMESGPRRCVHVLDTTIARQVLGAAAMRRYC